MGLGINLDSEVMLQIYFVCAVLLGAVVCHVLLAKLLLMLSRQADKSHSKFDDLMLESIRLPLISLIWLIAITWSIQVLGSQIFELESAIIDTIRDTLIILFCSWSFFRVIDALEKFWKINIRGKKARLDIATIHAIGKVFKLIAVCMTVLILMQYYGFNISGVLAFGGVGGVAVGFAAKDLLANFFGALMVFLDRPFSIGDWIRSPDQEIEGVVEHIGWRVTTIRTFDKRPLYVPNSLFTTIAVENPSRMSNRRIYETISVRYGDSDKLAVIVNEVKQMLIQHEHIDQRQTMIVNFNAFNQSSLDFFVYTFTRTVDWIEYHQIKQDVLLKIVDIVHRCGADFAFPTMTMHIEDKNLSKDKLPVNPIMNEKNQ